MESPRKKHTAEISHLEIRRLQAPVAVGLIREFAKSVGMAKALEIAAAAIQSDAMAAGKAAAEKLGRNTLKDLARLVREVWSRDEAMTVEFLEETDRNLSFNVTRCRYAELYRNMGILDFGVCLSCCRDEPFIRGFNPRIRLLRTQTVMQGAPYCDFRYALGS